MGELHLSSWKILWTITILSLIVLITTAYLPHTIVVQAPLFPGTLLVSPSSQSLAPPNSIINYNVRVSNMDPFNAWDIMVNATDTEINATSLSISSNLLAQYGGVQELINCVNGGKGISTGQPGDIGCTGDDGEGRIHSAAVLYSNLSPPGSSGLLFNITYHSGSGPGSPVIIFNDRLANGSNNYLAYNLQQGSYGSPPPGFFFELNPKTIGVIGGGWRRADVVLTSYGGFTGDVNLNAAVISSPEATIIFTPKTLSLTSGITVTSIMNVTTTPTSKPGTYFANVNATSGSVTHTIFVTIVINPGRAIGHIQDFSVSASSATVGDKITVTTTISNIGTITGSAMTLAVIWQGFLVTNHTVTLPPNQSKAFTDTWDTTGFPPANATLQWQLLNQDAKNLSFDLKAPPSVPFYLDPLFLGVLGLVIVAPSFVYVRHRGLHSSKKRQ